MHVGFAAQVDDREQKVAKLGLESCATRRVVARGRELVADLADLLVDFLERALDARPIEPDAGGAILKPKGAVQGRKVGRETVDDARAALRLHLLPRLLHAVAVQMRVSRLSSS